MLISIDIETAPGVGFEQWTAGPNGKPGDAALDHYRNRITLIAVVVDGGPEYVFETVEQFNEWLGDRAQWLETPSFCYYGGKFDLKTLITKGAHLTPDDMEDDGLIMAVALSEKIPDGWLSHYAAERSRLNAIAGSEVHRNARQHSLKTVAPYFLGVEPFWEVADHADKQYALKDARYTLEWIKKGEQLLKEDGSYEFYKNRLLNWYKLLLRAELEGIPIDLNLLAKKKAESQAALENLSKQITQAWTPVYEAWERKQARELAEKYKAMELAALERAASAKNSKQTPDSIKEKYARLFEAAVQKIERFDINSPSQLAWALRDYYNLDITNLEGDESTGKEVLNKLSAEGRTDVGLLLDYRKHQKRLSAFIPTYEAMHWNGRIYTNLNIDIARTGRLSSNGPNMQQVPGDYHELFIPNPGRRFLCRDLSNIEPNVIAFLTDCPVLAPILVGGRNFHDVNTKIFFELDDSIPDAEIKKKYLKERNVAKELGLLLLYGGGWKRIQISFRKHGFERSAAHCKLIYNRFRTTYHAIFAYKADLDSILSSGQSVANILGRRYRIPNADDIYMKGFNTMIQSSGSDMLINSAYLADKEYRELGLDARPVLFVHDEVIVDTAEACAEQAEAILLKHMLGYKLITEFGQIALKAEGGIYDHWAKG